MDKNIVKYLYENKEYYEYLKQNSEWVKELKRNPNRFKDFIKFVKEKYKLRTRDKVNNIVNKAQVLSEVLSTLK